GLRGLGMGMGLRASRGARNYGERTRMLGDRRIDEDAVCLWGDPVSAFGDAGRQYCYLLSVLLPDDVSLQAELVPGLGLGWGVLCVYVSFEEIEEATGGCSRAPSEDVHREDHLGEGVIGFHWRSFIERIVLGRVSLVGEDVGGDDFFTLSCLTFAAHRLMEFMATVRGWVRQGGRNQCILGGGSLVVLMPFLVFRCIDSVILTWAVLA
ncbi:hypothetical protein Dimus_000348, partial [Dionaea muscipula]